MIEPPYAQEYAGRPAFDRSQVAPHAEQAEGHRARRSLGGRVVALGGGTGLPLVLQGLKAALFPPASSRVPVRDRDRITAIVTIADDGGSSGRLRRAYGVQPPGDIRNCLLALADGDSTMATIFNFRFSGENEVGGHSLGNLILTALNQVAGDFGGAVERGSELLGIRGRVLPATREDVTLKAEFDDGSYVAGESQIALVGRPIRRVRLQPEGVRALPQALEAIAAADLVVIGPGSLYTSLIPVLLVEELADALADSGARIVLVMNLMTEPGETDHYTAVDHLLAIRRHAPGVPIHTVLLNTQPIPEPVLATYAAEGAKPVPPDTELLRALGYQQIQRDLLSTGAKIRHDPHKVGKILHELAMEAAA